MVSLLTKEEISRSPINHSTSKQMYSFSRAERFPAVRRGYCDTFYNVPSMTMTRYATLGRGTKSDFTREGRGKNPEFYHVKRDFDKGNIRGPAFSFGICRESYAKVYYETNKTFDKNVPGPGKYNATKPIGYGSPSYTMRGRFHHGSGAGGKSSTASSANDTPGPGTYKPAIYINPRGKYPSSRIENVREVDFGAFKSKRFNYNYNNYPAPNAYPLKSLLGQNFNSKYKSSQDKSILGRYKDYDSRANYPGPGAYRAFSEFGIYGPEKANTEPNRSSQARKSTKGKSQKKNQETTGGNTKPTEEDNTKGNNQRIRSNRSSIDAEKREEKQPETREQNKQSETREQNQQQETREQNPPTESREQNQQPETREQNPPAESREQNQQQETREQNPPAESREQNQQPETREDNKVAEA